MAGAPDSLCRWLVGKLITIPGGEGQDLLLLGLLNSLFVLLLARCLLLGVSRALLAAVVLALHADFVMSVEGTALVTASVDTHTDGLLNAWYQGSRSACLEQLIRLESQAILGEECAGTLLLHGIAVEDWSELDGCGCGCLDAGGGSEVVGGSSSSRTEISVISNKP